MSEVRSLGPPALPITVGGPPSGAFLAALQALVGALTGETAALTALLTEVVTGHWVPAPAHDNSTGVAGQIAYDSGFFYACVATNSWRRVAIAAGW